MKKLFIILLLFSSIYTVGQTDYTVSGLGGADYIDLSEVQTAINAGTFDGGANINLNRGEIFDGTLTFTSHSGVEGTPIKLDAYGSGADPIITTVDTVVDSWSVFSGNIRQVTLSGAPTDILFLWANGVKQTLGRLPNTGYYKLNSDTASQTSLWDDDRNEADDYWNGVGIVIHTADWALERRVITDFTQSTSEMIVPALDYAPGGFYDSTDMGYFFQNSTLVLDQQGEWYYNTSTNVLYFYGDPSGIEFTYAHSGDLITLNGSDHITIKNIQFEKADGIAVNSINSDYTLIGNCSFYYLKNGVYSINSDFDTVSNSYIEDISTNGIEFVRNYYGAIIDNELNRIAIVAGEGEDINAGDGLKAIHLNAVFQNGRYEGCDSVLIARNRIDSVGHSGVHFQMSNNTKVDKNWISQACQLKYDAGSIYAWHNADSAHIPGEINYVIDYDSSWIRKNKIELNYNALDKSWMSSRVGEDTVAQVFGIYLDDGNMNMRVDSNLVTGHNFNIFLHNTGHSTYSNNIEYGSRYYGLYGRNNEDANKDTITDSDFNDNIYIEYYDGVDELYKYNQFLLYVYDTYNNTYDGNYYMFPFGKMFGSTDIASGYNDVDGSFGWNLSEWESWSSETNANTHPFTYSQTTLTDRDSLVLLLYNFSETSINAEDSFEDGYLYYDKDSNNITSEVIEPYESKVYFLNHGEAEPPTPPEESQLTEELSYNPMFRINGKYAKINGKFLVEKNTLLRDLEAYYNADSIKIDSLTFNSTGQLVTYANADTVVLDGANEVVIGNSIRFGDPLIATNYVILDTLGSADTLILNNPFTGSVTDEFFWGGVNTLYDLSGNGNNATQTTGVQQPKLIWGETNSAKVAFNGIDDFLEAPTGFDFGTNDFSIYVNVRVNEDRFNNIISNKKLGQAVTGFVFGFNPQIDNLFFDIGTTGVINAAIHPYLINEYVKAVGIRSATIHSLYIDNDKGTDGNQEEESANSQRTFRIGYDETAARRLNGSIKEIRVYNRVLIPEEIKVLSQ